MIHLWLGLLANTAIVALVISFWTNARFSRLELTPLTRNFGFGLLFGLGAISVMLVPFQLEQGVLIDLRMTMIALAGYFGGPLSGAVTALLAAAYRVHIGGAGVMPGLIGIMIATGVGVVGAMLKRSQVPTVGGSFLLAAALAVMSGLSFLVLLPGELQQSLHVLAPIVTIMFLATLMAGLAISNEMRRREVEQHNHMYRRVIDSLPDCLNVKDTDGRFVMANPATAQLMNAQSADALLGKTDFDFYPEEQARAYSADEQLALSAGQSAIYEQRFEKVDGSRGWLSTLKAPLHDAEGKLVGIISHNRDITERKRLEAALAESDRRAAEALTSISDGLVMFDKDLNMVFCNERYRAMFHRTADLRVPGTPAAAILYASLARGELVGIAPDNAEAFVNNALSRLRQAGTVQFPLADGRWIESRTRPAEDGSCFIVCSDITKSKQDEMALLELNHQLSVLAETDGLTGLLNRRAFDALLADEVNRVGRGEGSLSLLMIDVDRFKAFNDTYGHGAGDQCLKAVADCLKVMARRPADRAVRYGGEEMVLVLPNTPEEGALVIAHEFCDRLRSLGMTHKGSEKGIVTASVGVATLPSGTVNFETSRFVARADEALYSAKAGGRDTVRNWQPSKPQLVRTEAS